VQAGVHASDAAALVSASKLEETLSSFASERKSMAQQAEQLAAQVAELRQQLLHCQQERDMLRDSMDEEAAVLLQVGGPLGMSHPHDRPHVALLACT
jgi:phage shock protein A